ncbi:GAF domain-containing protein [Streptomyces sp. BK208]|uniref:ANTAR domain-containing protein n=1 Tax=Streptomyces sp. BK208 TaxID=2512150 RepID=UPI0010611CF8|nr:ANTAR domain-containing protein [Streptomyces sp. BK208]TDT42132.1 GAF domain-containing protein [Streptomyces sp. BK208]
MAPLSQYPSGETTPTPPSGSGESPKDPRWAQEQLDLRNRQLGHAGVARAQGILAGRYRLQGSEEAFALLKTASQQSNIKLHTLADAVVRTPAPDPEATAWFPGRARSHPPRLPWLRPEGSARHNQGAVLKAALHRVLTITQTPMGNVQLAESGRLHLARHTGLNEYFTDFFAFVDAPTTSCAQAASARRQVTVRDVGTAAVFDEASRHAILQTGSRAAHSLPLANANGQVLGMISSHHERPSSGFTRAQLAALQQTGTDVGRWLSWHWRTVVLDALEHLHTQAVSTCRRPDGAPVGP